jgi:methyl-accepting chemotaxis protein
MEQISAGAQEAARSSEASREATAEASGLLEQAAESAKLGMTKTRNLQSLVASLKARVDDSIENITAASDRQASSVERVSELEHQATSIGEIVKAVARIADQTNLLALNAAIEAARAGQHGKGFAVVADEVRKLAESSEKSAVEIEELVQAIQGEVTGIGAAIRASAESAAQEAEKGKAVLERLAETEREMRDIVEGVGRMEKGAAESSAAATQAAGNAQSISAAAEEQAAAVEESLRTVEAQTSSLSQSEGAARSLSELAEDLRSSSDIDKSAEELAAAAEELSAAVEEISQSAREVRAALEQIEQGAEAQARAASEASAAMAQIEQGCHATREQATEAVQSGEAIDRDIADNRESIDALVRGVEESLEKTLATRERMLGLQKRSREIDKIVDTISTVAIQTNMLAVNGSVEAARAGDFGTGFAVVSTDIRNLAEESAENADRIKTLVKAIQEQVGVVRSDLEEIAAAARVEVKKNGEIRASLGEVASEMAQVLDASRELRTGAEKILGHVEGVRKGVDEVAAAAEEANRSAAEARTASSEQAQTAEQLSAAVEQIASMADELQSG